MTSPDKSTGDRVVDGVAITPVMALILESANTEDNNKKIIMLIL